MTRFFAHLALIMTIVIIHRSGIAAPDITLEERAFILDVHRRNLGEIELARLVPDRTVTPVVRTFAQRVIEDHTALDREIEQLARERSIALPTEINPEAYTSRTELKPLSGREFDRVYMRRALQEHRATVGRFDEQTRNARDSGVREFARTASARLREHLALAHHFEAAPPPLSTPADSAH
jgi:putative membrane protein